MQVEPSSIVRLSLIACKPEDQRATASFSLIQHYVYIEAQFLSLAASQNGKMVEMLSKNHRLRLGNDAVGDDSIPYVKMD